MNWSFIPNYKFVDFSPQKEEEGKQYFILKIFKTGKNSLKKVSIPKKFKNYFIILIEQAKIANKQSYLFWVLPNKIFYKIPFWGKNTWDVNLPS